MKSTFVKLPPKIIRYREFKNFSTENFQTDLEKSLRSNNSFDYQIFHSITENVLQKHVPLQQRVIRGNNKPHIKPELRKAIMTRTRLRNQANRSGLDGDYKKYKRQRNLVVNMNRKAKRDFFHSLEANRIDNDKKFWKVVKPIFSNSDPMGEKLTLIENGEIMSNDKAIAECLNSHFVGITDSLGLNAFSKTNETDVSVDNRVDMSIDKYKSHPGTTTIKKRVRIYKQFEFSNIDLFNTISKIQALDSSKASSGNIPTAIIRDAKEVTCPYLTSCINAVINNCYFPDKLKEADVTAIHKNGDKCHKQNYRPISALPNMSKIIERIMNEEITQHLVGIISPLLSGFRQRYNTQHALFRVIEIWKKCLDMLGTIGTILMDLSKAYH